MSYSYVILHWLLTVVKMTLCINCTQDSVWKEDQNNYIAHIPMPGIRTPTIHQRGNIINISGNDRDLGLSYDYTLTLRPDATQTINVRNHHGMVIISTGKVANVDRELPIVHPPAEA